MDIDILRPDSRVFKRVYISIECDVRLSERQPSESQSARLQPCLTAKRHKRKRKAKV